MSASGSDQRSRGLYEDRKYKNGNTVPRVI